MKRNIVIIVLLLAVASAWAADATFRSIDNGSVTVSRSTGLRETARSRDELESGDTIITGPSASAELDLFRSGRIIVGPDTVLTIQDLVVEGETATVLIVAIGSVELFFPRKTELVKTIGSQTSVATAQGTPITVYVAADGTTRFEVPADAAGSIVAVAGSYDDLLDDWTIALDVGQGIELEPAARPSAGDVYDVTGPTVFAEWNTIRYQDMVSDAGRVIQLLTRELNVFAGNIKEIEPLVQDAKDEISEHMPTYALKAERDGAKAANEYYLQNITPLQVLVAGYTAEMRFNAVLSLLVRRHTLSTLFLELSSRYFDTPDDTAYSEFRAAYDEFVDRYEAEIAPRLEPTDAL